MILAMDLWHFMRTGHNTLLAVKLEWKDKPTGSFYMLMTNLKSLWCELISNEALVSRTIANNPAVEGDNGYLDLLREAFMVEDKKLYSFKDGEDGPMVIYMEAFLISIDMRYKMRFTLEKECAGRFHEEIMMQMMGTLMYYKLYSDELLHVIAQKDQEIMNHLKARVNDPSLILGTVPRKFGEKETATKCVETVKAVLSSVDLVDKIIKFMNSIKDLFNTKWFRGIPIFGFPEQLVEAREETPSEGTQKETLRKEAQEKVPREELQEETLSEECQDSPTSSVKSETNTPCYPSSPDKSPKAKTSKVEKSLGL